jgi:CubicO group peptidase (beta-lactamase class C family)
MNDLKKVDDAFADAIRAKTFSGAQIRAGKGRKNVWAADYGRVSEAPGAAAVNPETRFDIASLTKPWATAMLAMRAEEKARLDLERPVSEYLPAFGRPERLTVRQLLAHTSGLPAWLPLFQEVAGKGWFDAEVADFYVSQIAATPLLQAPGEKRIYSDLGFILLGFILEAVHGRKLDALFFEEVARPLGLTATGFNPLRAQPPVSADRIAATEACPWRGRILQGEVHDDNAFALGGVAGHAGLFSTAADLEKWVHALFFVWEGKSGLVRPSTLKRYLGAEVFPKLGWDTVSPGESQAGKYFSEAAVGHLAFTGCSLWLDLADQKYIILLSNRVHPSRENEAIKTFRPKIHDLLVESLGLA